MVCLTVGRALTLLRIWSLIKALLGSSYCQRLQKPSFWGGEVEILVLSRMLKVPIYVFKTAEEAGRCLPGSHAHRVQLNALYSCPLRVQPSLPRQGLSSKLPVSRPVLCLHYVW